jgi:hypothetical protein
MNKKILLSFNQRGKYVNLENLNCKIKSGCKEHPPWPRGICNKCQPNTVYLNRQVRKGNLKKKEDILIKLNFI